jgi:hypothetical protein
MHMPLEKRSKTRKVHRIFGETERRKDLEVAAVRRRQTKWQNPDGREKFGNFAQSYTKVSQHGSLAQS